MGADETDVIESVKLIYTGGIYILKGLFGVFKYSLGVLIAGIKWMRPPKDKTGKAEKENTKVVKT